MKLGVILIALSLLFLVGCMNEPEEDVLSILPEGWIIAIEDNSTPSGWKGDPECKLVAVANPNEEYQHELMEFNNTAWHDFWFCSKDWDGVEPEFSPMEQRYPASLICECKGYIIFHQTMGNNSQPDFPYRVVELFK